jgi:hypothetical protein
MIQLNNLTTFFNYSTVLERERISEMGETSERYILCFYADTVSVLYSPPVAGAYL